MGIIANWGIKMIFKVNSEKIYTFSSMRREVKSRWAVHELSARKPLSEFLGPGQDSISMQVVLSAYRGLNPRQILNALDQYVRYGHAEYLFIGGQKVGVGKMYIESMSQEWQMIDDEGGLLMAPVDLTFCEYGDPSEAL